MSKTLSRQESNSVRLTIHVLTRKDETKLFCEPDGTITMHVAAPPVKDKANHEIRKWLARKTGTSSSNVRVIAGLHSNVKVIEITGMTNAEVAASLGIG